MGRGSSAGVLRYPTPRSRHWLQEYLRTAAQDPAVLAVVAIGSAVRPKVKSVDLDLLVITAERPRPVPSPIEVDVRQYNAAEIYSKVQRGNDLLGWAIRYGVVLLEKDAFWTAFADKLRGSVPLPSAHEARGRAAKARKYAEQLIAAGDEDAASEQAISYLTHLARAELIDHSIYPISRPELPGQLRQLGDHQLADLLEAAINSSVPVRIILQKVPSFQSQ
jgi:hypothetical protein